MVDPSIRGRQGRKVAPSGWHKQGAAPSLAPGIVPDKPSGCVGVVSAPFSRRSALVQFCRRKCPLDRHEVSRAAKIGDIPS